MPWSGQDFASRHNHGLSPAHAAHAASVANAILKRSGDEGLAIATANAREKERHATGGGIKPDPLYPVHLTVEMSKWEDLGGLVDFWRYVKNTANGGHSFVIEADREGMQPAKAKVSVDGDGSDKVGCIFLNGEDVTKPRRAMGGGITPIAQAGAHMPHIGAPMGGERRVGLSPISHQGGFHMPSIRLPRRQDGGMTGATPSPTPASTPGLQPSIANANPMVSGYIQRFQQMSPEQLQEMVARLGGSPLGAIAQHVLQQKRVMPPAPAPAQTAQQTPLSPAPTAQQQPAPSTGMQPAQAPQQQARGGQTQKKKDPPGTVPILAAGGEFIVAPHYVARFGNGDTSEGHKWFDKFVVEQRKKIVDTMKGLKPPVKN
jgi:hypothetical protein